MKKNLSINYHQYADMNELEVEDRELIQAAVEAASSSYAPYSEFNVGAAVRLSNGAVVKGSNQENVAYPSGMCAERIALFSAGAQFPDETALSLALVGMEGGKITEMPVMPCGACRQVMAEYQRKSGSGTGAADSDCKMSVICCGSASILKFDSVESILPFGFEWK